MSNTSKMALLTEHLRHTPVSLLDDIIDSINKLAWKAVDAVEAGLSSAPPSSLGINIDPSDPKSAELEAQVKLEIESGAHKLETLLGSTIDKNFDKMEVFALRSIVAVPEGLEDWITLEHYEGLNFTLPADLPTIDSVRLQRARVQEAQRLHRLLMAESAKNRATIAQLRALRGLPPKTSLQTTSKAEPSDTNNGSEMAPPYPVFAHLEDKSTLDAGAAETPLSTTTAFALSQLPALKTLLAELRLQERQLEEGEARTGEAEGKTWRRERVEYIESQTRRYLEGKGLELGKDGEVRDGEWQGGGRKLNRGEVEDLESVVGLMGGRKSGGENEDDEMVDA